MATAARFNFRQVDKGWRKLRKSMLGKQAYVKIGVLSKAGSEVVAIAVAHEYGTKQVPQRSFIRSAFDLHRNRYVHELRQLVKQIYGGKRSIDEVLGIMGLRIQTDIKAGITQGKGIPPPNARATIRRKGSSRPLIDTGRMLGSIIWQVVKGKAK